MPSFSIAHTLFTTALRSSPSGVLPQRQCSLDWVNSHLIVVIYYSGVTVKSIAAVLTLAEENLYSYSEASSIPNISAVFSLSWVHRDQKREKTIANEKTT